MENVISIGNKYPIDAGVHLECMCAVNESVRFEHPEIANWTSLNNTACLVRSFKQLLVVFMVKNCISGDERYTNRRWVLQTALCPKRLLNVRDPLLWNVYFIDNIKGFQEFVILPINSKQKLLKTLTKPLQMM